MCGKRTSFPNKNHNLKCIICGKYFCLGRTGTRQTCSEECKKKLYLRNNPFLSTSPFRKGINEKLRGRHLTKAQRQHLSEVRRGKPNPKLGGRRPNEKAKEKLSKVNRGNQSWKLRKTTGNLEEHQRILEEELQKIPLVSVRTDKIRPDAILFDWKSKRILALEIELSNPYAKRKLYEDNDNFGFDLVIIKGKRDGKIATYFEVRRDQKNGKDWEKTGEESKRKKD